VTDQTISFAYPDARLLIFSRAPIPGKVKSRLIPAIGETAAAELHRLMTQNIVSLAAEASLCPVELWCDDVSHEFFQTLSERFNVKLCLQQGRDLGERMHHAARCALAQADSVIIVGSDCLQFTTDHFRTTLHELSLDECDVVVTPALDGGYVLLGLKSIDKRIFQDISWGTGDVMSQTRAALQALRWQWKEMPALRDTDIREDLMDVLSNRHQYRPDAGIDALLQQLELRGS
jgi:rSAM/selenodomain-associated transferase 1